MQYLKNDLRQRWDPEQKSLYFEVIQRIGSNCLSYIVGLDKNAKIIDKEQAGSKSLVLSLNIHTEKKNKKIYTAIPNTQKVTIIPNRQLTPIIYAQQK